MSKSTPETQHYDSQGKPRPSIALKWGKTPRDNHTFEGDKVPYDPSASQSTTKAAEENESIDWESYYSPEEAAALRAKGVNPALKAEMEYKTKKAEGRGFWVKLGQTALGGGVIK